MPPKVNNGVRDHYAQHPHGASGWYATGGGDEYRNPHEDAVTAMVALALNRWPELRRNRTNDAARMLDFCTGSGEVVRALINNGIPTEWIDASDPYTGASFERMNARELSANWSFEDVANGAVANHSWHTVWCSYALHLCEPSWLPLVCQHLALASQHLVIITPHKRPEIIPAWGYVLVDEHRDSAWRVRLRRYDSTVFPTNS